MAKRKYFTLSALIGVFGLLVVSAGAVMAESPKYGGVLKYGLSTDPPNFDPQKTSGGTAAMVVKNQFYNGLIRYWKDYKIDYDLAKSYEVTEGGKVYTFHLHENVYWHNGEKLTMEDVKFSFDRILDPKSAAANHKDLANLIDRIEIVGANTVRFVLKNPSPSFLNIMASTTAKVISKSFVEGGADLNKQLMGTGPFKLAEYTPAVHLKVEKNKNYFKKGLPYLDGIDFVFYKDDTTRVTALRSGAIDLMGYVPWKQMEAVERNDKLQLLSDKGMLFMMALCNVKKAPLDNAKVRQALAWAVDRQAIVNSVFFGRGSVIGGFAYPPSWPEYVPELDNTYGYDVEKTKKLLTEAGYPNGFKLTVLATHQYGMHKGTGEILQAYFKEAGLDCDLELVDWATVVKRQEAGQFDVLVMGTMLSYRDPSGLTKFVKSGDYYPKACGFSDPQIDKWMDEGAFEMDPGKRKEIYAKVQKRALELSPILYLTWREQAEGAQAYVKGYAHIPGIYDSSRTLEVTWLDK